jgi:hypothetical protein
MRFASIGAELDVEEGVVERPKLKCRIARVRMVWCGL